ncbi:MAG: hypothetical protein U0I76_01425, partial [Lachnospiraceae bacterium]|nr:hypothetical protein [Lachnospiraceae bacterium]
ALGAGVDGCRSNRASARECAKAHSFYVFQRKGISWEENPFDRIPDRHSAVQRTFLQIERRLKNEFFMANCI